MNDLAERAACRSKKGYDRKSEAKRALNLLRRTGNAANAKLHIYECPVCQMYHIGHERIVTAKRRQARFNQSERRRGISDTTDE